MQLLHAHGLLELGRLLGQLFGCRIPTEKPVRGLTALLQPQSSPPTAEEDSRRSCSASPNSDSGAQKRALLLPKGLRLAAFLLDLVKS